MFRAFAREVKAPLLANMTEFGKTPVFTAGEFEAMGYRMVIWPSAAFRAAARAQSEVYAAIGRDGGSHKMLERMQTRDELMALIGYAEYEKLESSLARRDAE
jgi:methylisocitrate lyase